jgi:hypothetical protein
MHDAGFRVRRVDTEGWIHVEACRPSTSKLLGKAAAASAAAASAAAPADDECLEQDLGFAVRCRDSLCMVANLDEDEDTVLRIVWTDTADHEGRAVVETGPAQGQFEVLEFEGTPEMRPLVSTPKPTALPSASCTNAYVVRPASRYAAVATAAGAAPGTAKSPPCERHHGVTGAPPGTGTVSAQKSRKLNESGAHDWYESSTKAKPAGGAARAHVLDDGADVVPSGHGAHADAVAPPAEYVCAGHGAHVLGPDRYCPGAQLKVDAHGQKREGAAVPGAAHVPEPSPKKHVEPSKPGAPRSLGEPCATLQRPPPPLPVDERIVVRSPAVVTPAKALPTHPP